jgi:hypothetical protein
LEAKAHPMDVDNAMHGHVLSQAALIGLYRR